MPAAILKKFETRYIKGEDYALSAKDPCIETHLADTGIQRAAIRDWAKRMKIRLREEYHIQKIWEGGHHTGWCITTYDWLPAVNQIRKAA